MTEPKRTDKLLPGITLTSLAAMALAMLAMGIIIQVIEVLLAIDFTAEHTLAIPAIVVFVAISLTCGLVALLTRRRVLTRPERFCVLFAMLMAAPLMTQGFWHRIVSITATIPRTSDFEKMDAFSDRLWPHGPNLLDGALARADGANLKLTGRVRWHETLCNDRRTSVPLLVNGDANEVSSIRIRLPRRAGGRDGVAGGEPYLISVLARARKLAPDAHCFCRIYRDDEAAYTDVFRSSEAGKVTFLHKQGFGRVGSYDVKFPAGIRHYAQLEFGLVGAGELELTDAKLLNVSALETAFSAKQLISRSDYEKLPADRRAGLIVKPDNPWSWEGVKFLLAGYIPVRDWAEPVLTWSAFVFLILLATLAINVVMRRQWIESERYQLPIAQVPMALLGPPGDGDRPVPAIWRNRVMWAGFAGALTWCLLRGWHFYNPNVPDLGVRVVLKDYIADPSWGQMFNNVFFEVSAIFVALATFMELNVLGSLLVGFAIYRSQYWFGELTGFGAHAGYPFANQQQVSAYVTYAALVLIFSRKHLRQVGREVVLGRSPASVRELFSYRTAAIVLVGSFAGIYAWGVWIGVSPWGMVAFFAFLVGLGLVTAKVRAECGTPFGYFACWNATMFLAMLGGMKVFSPGVVLTAMMSSFFLCETVFFLIPGAQFELIELGRRYRVARRHLVYTVVLGLAGGMLVGGWVFLSNAYSVGGETVRYQWAFWDKAWYFFPFNTDLQEATTSLTGQGTAAAEGVQPATYAYAFGAVVTAATAILRQVFAGFWFHPLGFILGMTRTMDFIWGSVLVALVIRSAVLWFGGAATVRRKLRPFFVGVFLGALASAVLWGLYAVYLYSQDMEMVYKAIP